MRHLNTKHRYTVILFAFLLAATFGVLSWSSWLGDRVSRWHGDLYNLQYFRDPYYRGRTENPAILSGTAVKCCRDSECSKNDRGRYAVMVPIRSKDYLGLVKELRCTLHQSNPGVPIVFLTVKGDLQPADLEQLYALGEVEFVEDLYFPNTLRKRFGMNWIKLQAWRLVHYDALLLLDADTLVLGDISHLFHLPTHYAATLRMHKWEYKFDSLGISQGGVMLLRPCAATADHMVELLQNDEMLRYEHDHAEQSFLDWYFKFDRMVLPMEYNYISYTLTDGGEMWSGGVPKILHLTRDKPWTGAVEGIPGHQYLCSSRHQRRVTG